MTEFKPQDSSCPNPIIPADPMPNAVADTGQMRLPTQVEMNQAFYVDVCNAERRLNQFIDDGKALLNSLPDHWHDETTTNLRDLIEDTEAVLQPGSHHAFRTEKAWRDYAGAGANQSHLAKVSALAAQPEAVRTAGEIAEDQPND